MSLYKELILYFITMTSKKQSKVLSIFVCVWFQQCSKMLLTIWLGPVKWPKDLVLSELAPDKLSGRCI